MIDYHFKGEAREIANHNAHWRRTFPTWVKEQMERIQAKLARGEKISAGETAVRSAYYFMNKKENAA